MFLSHIGLIELIDVIFPGSQARWVEGKSPESTLLDFGFRRMYYDDRTKPDERQARCASET
jgi:hypothetical protein